MKAYAAMSGGVDSAVCAVILREQGYDVTGVTYRLCGRTSARAREAEEQAVTSAAGVCESLGIPHEVVCLYDRFEEYVVSAFVGAYESGRTPNPCISCNRHIKFSMIPEGAVLATGHYARLAHDEETGRYYVRMAKDLAKDQSYMLYSLSQETLRSVRFPLGELTKPEVRGLAAKAGLAAAERKDSQDICFVPDGDHAAFIESRGVISRPGEFVTSDGKVLGTHKGLINYTIGQRRGLGLSLPESLYVTGLDIAGNRVLLGRDCELWSREVCAEDVCFMKYASIEKPMRVLAKIRYAHRPSPAVASFEDGKLHVTFDESQRAVTPGQALVLYEDDGIVAGGTIVR